MGTLSPTYWWGNSAGGENVQGGSRQRSQDQKPSPEPEALHWYLPLTSLLSSLSSLASGALSVTKGSYYLHYKLVSVKCFLVIYWRVDEANKENDKVLFFLIHFNVWVLVFWWLLQESIYLSSCTKRWRDDVPPVQGAEDWEERRVGHWICRSVVPGAGEPGRGRREEVTASAG